VGPHPLLVDEDDLTQDLDLEFQSDLSEIKGANIFGAEFICDSQTTSQCLAEAAQNDAKSLNSGT